MRVALLLAGQPRGLKVAYEYVKRNLLDIHNPDVFIHTWNIPDTKIMDEAYNLYKPVNYKFMNQFSKEYISQFEYPDKYSLISCNDYPAFNTIHSFASIFYANQLKKEHEMYNGFTYDVVIKSRFDYCLNRQLPLEDMIPGKIYVPKSKFHAEDGVTCNDQFAFSSSHIMDMYCSTFNEIYFLYNRGFRIIGEDLLSGCLQIHELTPSLVHIDMNDPFPPGKYNGDPHSLYRENVEEWRKVN